jgi:hypothetical protein
MIGPQNDQAPKVTLHAIDSAQAFAEHGAVIQELGLVRLICETGVNDVEGFRGATVFAQ